MLSYKEWQKLNESVGTHTLGLGRPTNLGAVGSRWDEGGMDMMPTKMMKKSKKMFGDAPAPDDGGGGMPPMPMKKKKPPMPPMGDEGGEEEDDLDSLGGEGPPMDDEEGGDEGPMPGDEEDGEEGGDDEGPMPPMGDDDEEGGDEGPMPPMGGDGGDEGGTLGDVPPPPAGGKKGGLLGKTKMVRDGAHMMHKGASKMIKGMKEGAHMAECACDKCKKSKKMPKMTREDAEFFQSLQAQAGSTRFAIDNETGDWVPVQEDAVIPPSDPNKGISQDDEPGPGEVGYAPQSRVGGVGSFNEWASKYGGKRKTGKAKPKNNGTKKQQPKPQQKSWFH